MKKIFLLLMLPLLALSLNSCSKDDGGDGNGNSSGKLVKTITYDSRNGYIEVANYEYDSQQRISKITFDDGDEYYFTFSYSDNSITVDEDGDIFQYILDENGYVIGTSEGDEYEYYNGKMSKSSWHYSPEESYEATYTWVNGNLIKVDYGSSIGTYVYNDMENKLNIDLFFDVFDISGINFKGTPFPKNYPISETYSGDDSYTFEYTFDSDGYPTKIVARDSDGNINDTQTITYY